MDRNISTEGRAEVTWSSWPQAKWRTVFSFVG